MSNPLAQVSLLLNLTIRQWSGEVSDVKALAAVAKAFSGDTSHDKYRKSLFVTDPLSPIRKCAGRVRNNFYKWTMAWLDGGDGRLVASMDFRDFALEHRSHVDEFEKQVDRFVADYPDHKDAAAERKGDLYNEAEYPSQNDLYDRFSVELTTLPFPDTRDFRITAPAEVIAELQSNMEGSLRTVAANVESDILERFGKRLSLLHEGLSSGKRWSKTLFEELEFIVRMGIHMDGVLSPDLSKTLAMVQSDILKYDPPKLRHSEAQQEECIALCHGALQNINTIMSKPVSAASKK